MNRKIIFDTVRELVGHGFTQAEVDRLDKAIDDAMAESSASDPHRADPQAAPTEPSPPFTVGARGAALIKKWEGCARRRPDGRFEAYPDPGSRDGHPWTIGWGSTGADVHAGTIWSQAECDARFDQQIARYAAEVIAAIGGAPTTQSQFDALVSFHYNTGRITRATLTRKHRIGDFAGAQAEFARWIYNDGKVLRGLARRRAEEAELYGRTN